MESNPGPIIVRHNGIIIHVCACMHMHVWKSCISVYINKLKSSEFDLRNKCWLHGV